MRILYHHRTLGEGAEGVHIRGMVRAWRDAGHEVRMHALVGIDADAERAQHRRWRAVSAMLPAALYEVAEMTYDAWAGRGLEAAVRSFRPDLVYDRHNSYSTAALRVARAAGVPAILEVNAPVALERSVDGHLRLRLPRVALAWERHALHAATRVVTVSSPLKDYLVARHGLDPRAITVLPNGAAPDRFRPAIDGGAVRRRWNLDGKAVAGFVGTARPWHGLPLAIEALARLKSAGRHVHFLVVGGGPDEPDLRALVQARGMDGDVTFTGPVPHDDVPAHIAAMDVALAPHATFYACPLKIVEYMAMGRAIVAPDLANLRDVLAHERNALLFRPLDAASLASTIERAIDDAPLRDRLGGAARRDVERRWNWRFNAQAVVDLAQRLPGAADPALPPPLALGRPG